MSHWGMLRVIFLIVIEFSLSCLDHRYIVNSIFLLFGKVVLITVCCTDDLSLL